MSFILDALRKSESERQQDARPSITRIPTAVPRHGLPPWAIATMGALGLGIVVLAGAWIGTFIGRSETPTRTAQNAPAAAAAVSDAPRDERAAAGPSAREAASPSRVEPLPLPPPRPLAAAAEPSPLAIAARAQPTPSRPAQPPAARPTDLPRVDANLEAYHTAAPSLGLPELTLQLLAYDENDPSQQYVFINGARYNVGDTLPGGARVIAINRRGAVLLVRGRQFQLEPR